MKVLKDMTDEPFASTTGEGGDAVALTKVRNDNFPEMKKWIEQFFDKLQVSCSIIPIIIIGSTYQLILASSC